MLSSELVPLSGHVFLLEPFARVHRLASRTLLSRIGFNLRTVISSRPSRILSGGTFLLLERLSRS